MKNKIIAMAGVARSGKSSCAEILAAILIRAGHEVFIKPIAETIKKAVPCDLNESKEEWRKRLISYGETQRKIHGDDYFVKQTLQNVPKNAIIIIDDLRLQKEYEELSKHNAIFIKMRIAPTIHIERFKSKTEHKTYQRSAKHDKTEIEVATLLPDSNFKYVINNSGNIEALMARIRKIAKDLTK